MPFKTFGFGYTIVQEVAGHTHIIVYTYIESKAELIEKIINFFFYIILRNLKVEITDRAVTYQLLLMVLILDGNSELGAS